MFDAPPDADDDDAEDERWCMEERLHVVEYLAAEPLTHGELGEWPAWHLSPYVAIWALESVARPGAVGWWVISGDLPCDYFSARSPVHPRTAVKDIADSWLKAVAELKPGDETIGDTTLPAYLAPLLKDRAEMLLAMLDEAELWEGLGPATR